MIESKMEADETSVGVEEVDYFQAYKSMLQAPQAKKLSEWIPIITRNAASKSGAVKALADAECELIAYTPAKKAHRAIVSSSKKQKLDAGKAGSSTDTNKANVAAFFAK